MSLLTNQLKPKVIAEFIKGRTPIELFHSKEFCLARRTFYKWFYEWRDQQEAELEASPNESGPTQEAA
ncbi:MAG: hypothetical protein AAF215_05455 [Cyanobacteria bacterium P01_A01_bin.123]